MDFIRFKQPEHLEHGLGKTNPTIEWSEDEVGAMHARLPYNATNEYHRMVAENSEQAVPPRGFELVATPVAGDPRLDQLGPNQRLDLRIVAA